MAEPEGQRGLAKRLRVEAANQRADARKEEKAVLGPKVASGEGEGKGDSQVPILGKPGKRKRSEQRVESTKD